MHSMHLILVPLSPPYVNVLSALQVYNCKVTTNLDFKFNDFLKKKNMIVGCSLKISTCDASRKRGHEGGGGSL